MNPEQSKNRRLLGLIGGVALAALAVKFMTTRHDSATAPAAVSPPLAVVQVHTVHAATEGGALQAIGRIKNVRESTITARAMGKVVRVAVKSGDLVKAGQLLAKLDDADASGRVSQAKGALAQADAARVIARQNLGRFEKLRESDSASEAKYEKAQFDYQSAVGAVEQATGALKTADAYLRETTIAAPFDGRIVDTLIEEGETAAPGHPVARMEGGNDIEFEASVNASDIAGVAIGQHVSVILDGPAGEPIELPGDVGEIVPAQDAITHTSLARIKMKPDERVRSGMFGRVRFAVGAKSCPSIYVPSTLLRRRGQLSALFVVDEASTVRLRLVTEGAQRGGETEVLSGVADGDMLVVSDVRELLDGQTARVQPNTIEGEK